MKPAIKIKAAETSDNYAAKKSYYAGQKSFMKKRYNRALRRANNTAAPEGGGTT